VTHTTIVIFTDIVCYILPNFTSISASISLKEPKHKIENIANTFKHIDIMQCDVMVISPFSLLLFQLWDTANVILMCCFKLRSVL